MKVFVTGSAGFIGFHLVRLLVREGHQVVGYDGITEGMYDIALKRQRHQVLLQNEGFSAFEAMLEDKVRLEGVIGDFAPDIIIHLAAQAGVLQSLENPHEYMSSNVMGTFNVLEAARAHCPKHLLMSSTSSVYGCNRLMPYKETHMADHPLNIYAATKKANEDLAHSYAHIWHTPTTMFRFFTVYGPWGRPDMALFKFVKAILEGRAIDIYNHGEMYRDFTYVEDLARAVRLLMDAVPPPPEEAGRPAPIEGDSLSPAAPYRVVNIGNSTKVKLLDFVDAIEEELGIKAHRNLMEMQKGDTPMTWADCGLLNQLTGYQPKTELKDGIAAFVKWYRDYYKV